MRRRELVFVLSSAVLTTRAARAQQMGRPVVGFLGNASPGPAASFVAAFREGLSQTGFTEGQNVTVEYRWAEGHYDRLPAFAAEFVSRKVDVILASAGVGIAAAKVQPRRFRSCSSVATTWSRLASLPVSRDREATSRASAFLLRSLTLSGSNYCPSWFLTSRRLHCL